MPAVSAKQEKFMQAVANNPKFAKKVGVSQSVGREFTKGSEMKKMKKMADGGMPMKTDPKTGEKKPAFLNKGGMAKMAMGGGVKAKMGAVKTGKPAMGSASKRADGVAVKGKTKGKEVAMNYGGKVKKMTHGGKC